MSVKLWNGETVELADIIVIMGCIISIKTVDGRILQGEQIKEVVR